MIDSDKCEEGLVLIIELEQSNISSQTKSYQTHVQPFHVLFHVGKTTVQACFVLVLKGVEPLFSDRKSDVLIRCTTEPKKLCGLKAF